MDLLHLLNRRRFEQNQHHWWPEVRTDAPAFNRAAFALAESADSAGCNFGHCWRGNCAGAVSYLKASLHFTSEVSIHWAERTGSDPVM